MLMRLRGSRDKALLNVDGSGGAVAHLAKVHVELLLGFTSSRSKPSRPARRGRRSSGRGRTFSANAALRTLRRRVRRLGLPAGWHPLRQRRGGLHGPHAPSSRPASQSCGPNGGAITTPAPARARRAATTPTRSSRCSRTGPRTNVARCRRSPGGGLRSRPAGRRTRGPRTRSPPPCSTSVEQLSRGSTGARTSCSLPRPRSSSSPCSRRAPSATTRATRCARSSRNVATGKSLVAANGGNARVPLPGPMATLDVYSKRGSLHCSTDASDEGYPIRVAASAADRCTRPSSRRRATLPAMPTPTSVLRVVLSRPRRSATRSSAAPTRAAGGGRGRRLSAQPRPRRAARAGRRRADLLARGSAKEDAATEPLHPRA